MGCFAIKKTRFALVAAFALIICLAGCFFSDSTAFAAENAPFDAVPSVQGDTLTISIKTNQAMQYATIKCSLASTLPDGFTYTGYRYGADFADYDGNIMINQETLNFILESNSTSNVSVGTGKELIVLEFDVPNLSSGTYTMTFGFPTAADQDGNPLDWKGSEAKATISKQTTKYTINPVSTPNGKVTADKKTAEKGETVTLTATSADERYKVDEVTVVDGNGKLIQLTDNGDGTYSFSMPASGVTVRAAFVAKDNAKFKTIVKDSENGSAITKPNSAKAGETVTVTTKPDDGYEIDTVKVKDSNSKSISVKENDNGTFTFVQPDGDVTVEVSFKATSHNISIEEPKNGTVNVKPKDTTIGEEVTITTIPDEGYEVDIVTVKDADGNKVRVTINNDGTYSFKIPANGARVIVTFKEINCPSASYTDVDPNKWYHEAIDYAIANGLMNGMSSTSFAPDGTLSRAMLVTILYRLEGTPAAGGANPFSDVADGTWYTDAVIWANANGIVNGYGDGTFLPDANVTREQFATILYRYAQFKEYDASVGENTNIRSYNDVDDISDWATPSMQWACGAGLMQGSNGNLRPQNSASRAEAAALLMRFIKNVK